MVATLAIPSVRKIAVLRSVPIGVPLLRRDIEGNWPERPAVTAIGELDLSRIGFCEPLVALHRTILLAHR
jgi:hypothetical protein